MIYIFTNQIFALLISSNQYYFVSLTRLARGRAGWLLLLRFAPLNYNPNAPANCVDATDVCWKFALFFFVSLSFFYLSSLSFVFALCLSVFVSLSLLLGNYFLLLYSWNDCFCIYPTFPSFSFYIQFFLSFFLFLLILFFLY